MDGATPQRGKVKSREQRTPPPLASS